MGFGTGAVTTGAPIAHTFAGIPGAPTSKKGVFMAAGGAALVLLLGVVGVSVAVKGKQGPAAASGVAATSVIPSVAVAPPTPPAPAPLPTHETLAPPVAETPQALAPAVSVVKARPQYNPAPAPPPPPAKPAAPPPGKKQKVDLGI
jgi:hypothetical protein